MIQQQRKQVTIKPDLVDSHQHEAILENDPKPNVGEDKNNNNIPGMVTPKERNDTNDEQQPQQT